MDLQEIGLVATELEHAVDEALKARDAEEQSAGDLLDRLAAKARPIVAVIGSREIDHYGYSSGNNGCNPVDETTYHGARGVKLIDGYKTRRDTTGNAGDYTGEVLLLTVNGFVEGTRKGSWSCWQGAWSRYDVTFRVMTGAEVAAEYDADDVVNAIVAAVERAAAKKPDATTHQKRAEKYRALAALL